MTDPRAITPDAALSFLERPLPQKVARHAALVIFLYALLQLIWPAPLGVLIQGTIVGSLTALIAFGITLVYRANRIINFAQGDLGAAPASFAVLLIVGPGVPYFLAMPIGLVCGAALGAAVEFLVIRRFFKAPRLILTVATIAVSQLLILLGLVMPRFFDITTPPQSFPSPFDFSFRIDPIVFRGNDIIAMIAIPATIAALALFFRFTHVGIAVRASAESSERAFLVGIPVKRIQMIVWMIASTLSTMALLLRAGIVGLPIGTVLGPGVLVAALAAAVMGRMEHLPTVFFSAVGLGILEQSIIWETGRSSLVAPVMLAVILLALLAQRKVSSRAGEQSSWQTATEVRPIPTELVHLPEIRFGVGFGKAALVLFALALPTLIPVSRTNLAALILIFAIIGISLVILTGWAGQISLGHMGLVALGGGAAASITSRLHWDLSLGLIGGGILGAVIALLIGLPALRMKGLFLAVTTLAFAVTTSTFFLSKEFFGWWLPSGRIQRPPLFGLIDVQSEAAFYYLCLAGLVLAMVSATALRHSRTGRVLIGVRENERAAQAFGINAMRAKLVAFALSGFFAAFAGGLFAHHQHGLGINAYAPEQSLLVFTMAVIGGLGSLPGAVLGAAYVQGFGYFFPGNGRLLTGGIGLLIILLFLPGGLGELMYRIRDYGLRAVANRRGIHAPSLVADSRLQEPDATPLPVDVDDDSAAAPGFDPAEHDPYVRESSARAASGSDDAASEKPPSPNGGDATTGTTPRRRRKPLEAAKQTAGAR